MRTTMTTSHVHAVLPTLMRYQLSERGMIVDAVVYTRRPGYLYTTPYWVQLRSSFCFLLPPLPLLQIIRQIHALQIRLPSERPVYVCAQCIADCWLHGTDRRLAVDTDTLASERPAPSRLFDC